jgi:chemotaxis methyl-accepting protein methylase
LNDNSLETARAGIYGEYALRDTRGTLRRKYFKDIGDKKLQANDLLKARIRFDRVNLSDDSRMLFQKRLDIIFCCNVLIYFDQASKRRVVQHFIPVCCPGATFSWDRQSLCSRWTIHSGWSISQPRRRTGDRRPLRPVEPKNEA